jgi:hypothetical protein
MASETSFASTLGAIQETNEVKSTDDKEIIPNDHQPFDEEESNTHNLPFIQEMKNLPISAIIVNTSPSNEMNPININSSTLNQTIANPQISINSEEEIPHQEEPTNDVNTPDRTLNIISLIPTNSPLNYTGDLIAFSGFGHAIQHLSQFMLENTADK